MGRPDPNLKESILSYLKANHTSIWRHWFDDIEPLEVTNGTLRLLVTEPVRLRYLRRCGLDPFRSAAQAATGRLLAVRFVGEGELGEDPVKGGDPRQRDRFQADDDMILSPDYSFDNFIVGPNNRLAHAAAFAVTEKPGKAYNPLFIHGGVGLGKTHLLQGICQATMHHNGGMRVYFVSCSGFMEQFHDAVRAGEMTSFRHRFRDVDLLVVDDIHDLSQHDRAQEEFFHTFNTLHQSGRQVVLSSDAPPSEITDLKERLTSRFNCGLVARIDKPCFETRVEIVRSKASLRGLELPDDVASYIGAKVDTNIRELEGAITQLQNLAAVSGSDISLELAKKAIGDHAPMVGGHHPTIQQIIDAVTRYYDVKLSDLLSKRRNKSIALPRQVGMWLARKHTRYSLEEIGGFFGGRDHTTVMHAIKAINRKREGDALLDGDVSRLENELVDHHVAPGMGE